METQYHKLTKKQQKIFDVSVELFYAKGFTETSVRDIAEILDIQAASLYAHISSKEQILEWIAQNYIDLIYIEFESFTKSTKTNSEKLRFMVRRNIDTIHNYKKYAEVFRRYLNEISPEIQKKYYDFTNAYETILTNILLNLQKESHLDFKPELAAKFLMYNMNYAYKWTPIEFTQDQIIDVFENKLLPCVIGKKLDN